MTKYPLGEKDNGKYIDEKELFILYSLLRKKFISNHQEAFIPSCGFHFHVTEEIKNDTSIINKRIIEARDARESTVSSSVIPSYLLTLGQELDEKGFSIHCDADYALEEGCFLSSEDFIMSDYKGIPVEEYLPIKEYQILITEKKGQKKFVELVNKLVTREPGGSWNKNDLNDFIDLYRTNNREGFKNMLINDGNILNIFGNDELMTMQEKLSRLIFKHANIVLRIEDISKLERDLNGYIDLFIKDKLRSFSQIGLTCGFFRRRLDVSLEQVIFGFKKQKEVLSAHISERYKQYQRNDLEVGSPYFEPEYIGDLENNKVKVTFSTEEDKEKELFLFVHTMLAFEKLGYLKISDLFCGTKEMFDTYDRGFVFDVLLPDHSPFIGTEEPLDPAQKKFNTLSKTGVVRDKNIKKLTIVKSKNDRSCIIIINDDYTGHPIKIDTIKPSWGLLLKVAKKETVGYGLALKPSIEYINSDKNRLITQTVMSKTKILEVQKNLVVPNIDLEVITDKAFATRKNKQTSA